MLGGGTGKRTFRDFPSVSGGNGRVVVEELDWAAGGLFQDFLGRPILMAC